MDAAALEAALKKVVSGEVRFDDGSRALYATDGSNYRQVPIGVVVPKSIDDVVNTVKLCRQFDAPVLSRGGGTSLAGECCNVAVVIDWSKYLNKVLEIDPGKKIGRVQPGCVLDDLRREAEKHGITFGPDPATHSHNTLGGMIGNDSCGVHSVMAAHAGTGARTADNIDCMDILLYDGTRMTVGKTSEEEWERIIQAGGRKGEIYAGMRDLRDKYADLIREKYPRIPRRVSGYNLAELLPENGGNIASALVGSEGTLVTVLEASCKLIPAPKARSLVVLGFPDVADAGDAAPKVMKHMPIGLEGMDEMLIDWMKKKGLHPKDVKILPDGKGWLLCEFGGDSKEDSDAKAKRLIEDAETWDPKPSDKLFDDPAEEQKIWEVREAGLAATADVPGVPAQWPGWEDSAVPPDKVGPYLRKLRELFIKYDYNTSLYGHFGQGCIHCRLPFDLKTQEGIDKWKRFLVEAAHLVVSFGGSLSGEHGDGQARAQLLPIMFGDELLDAMRQFKRLWDPDWKMNPGKVIDAYAVDENLRLGAHYNPPQPKTYFQYLEDGGSFAEATLRCVGVGKCRRHEGGVMCPSYMVTKEEADSTRGRAHLLFEMLQGSPLTDGWRDQAVYDALDLCLACKGCTAQCPVNVDMPTYKAEFRAHYFEGRLAPARPLRLRLHPRLGASGQPRAGPGDARQRRHLHAASAGRGQMAGRHGAVAKHPAVRPGAVYALVGEASGEKHGQAESRAVPGHVQQLLPSQCRQSRRRSAGSGGLAGRRAAERHVLRAAFVRLRLHGRRRALDGTYPPNHERRNPGRTALRLSGAFLRVGLSGRHDEADAGRRERQASQQERLFAQ